MSLVARRSLAGLGAALAWSCGNSSPVDLRRVEPIPPFRGPYRLSLTASASCGQPAWAWSWNGEGTGSGANSLVTLPGGDDRVAVRVYDLQSPFEPPRALVVLDLEMAPTDGLARVSFYSLIESVVVPPGGRPRVSGMAAGLLEVWDAESMRERSCDAADHTWELSPR